jgi:hypothetical protein
VRNKPSDNYFLTPSRICPEQGWRDRLAVSALGILLLAGCNHSVPALLPAAEPQLVHAAATGPLRVSPENPYFFVDGSGKAVFLAGSHTWSNFLDKGTSDPPPVFDYDGYLKFLSAHNMNFFRLWEWTLSNGGTATEEYEPYSGPYHAWQRTGPGIANDGKPKFDVTKFEQRYFDRMRQRILQAGQRGIYVSVMLFNSFEFQYDVNSADGNPFAGANNINGISCEKTCPIDFSQAPSAGAWAVEQAYLRKVIDTVNDLDNVLYEVGNEPPSPTADVWQAQVVSYVKSYEAGKPKQHPVGVNPGTGTTDAALYAMPGDWVSPGALVPAANATTKVVVSDTDHSCYYTCLQRLGSAGQLEWAWENFTSGNNLLFMDPYLVQWKDRNSPEGLCSGGQCTALDPRWETIRSAIAQTRTFAEKINLTAMRPRGDLSSSGFCLASPGSEYLIYRPAARGWRARVPWLSHSLTIKMVAGVYHYEWFSPTLGKQTAPGTMTLASGSESLTVPFDGDSVLWLHK